MEGVAFTNLIIIIILIYLVVMIFWIYKIMQEEAAKEAVKDKKRKFILHWIASLDEHIGSEDVKIPKEYHFAFYKDIFIKNETCVRKYSMKGCETAQLKFVDKKLVYVKLPPSWEEFEWGPNPANYRL